MRYIAIFLITLGLLYSQLATSDEKVTQPLSSDEKFEIIDVDQDGFITMQEATKLKGLPEKFIAVDANQDGKLVLTEFAESQLEQ